MSNTVLDSCCLINLCAVGGLSAWMGNVGVTWHIPSAVLSEALFLRVADGVDASGKVRLDISVDIDGGLIESCDTTAESEVDLYVDLARELDDGEAMGLAIAHCRGWRLATDDGLARDKARALGVEVITTPELVRLWAHATDAQSPQIRTAVEAVRDRARFIPGREFPHWDWWHAHLNGHGSVVGSCG